PLIQQNQKALQGKQTLAALKTIMDLQKSGTDISKSQAETSKLKAEAEDIPLKRQQEGKKADIDLAIDKAKLILDKAGFKEDQIQAALKQIKDEFHSQSQLLEAKRALLKAEEESQKDPHLAQLIATAKMTKDPKLVDVITNIMEQKTGMHLRDNRPWYQFWGDNPVGTPLEAPAAQKSETTVTTSKPQATLSEEDQLLNSLMGQ